jgi:flagellin-like protein
MKKAISPIVATVLIVAATLIAAAAIIGYIFGIFGSTSTTANVSATSAAFTHLGTSNVGAVTLYNTGSGNAYEMAVSVSYQGTTCTLPVASVTGGGSGNPIIGGGTQTLLISVTTAGQFCSGVTAMAGNAFNGYVVLSNGEQASFVGTFT